MGLFTGLLTLPLAPVRGTTWVAEQIAEEADRQLYDEQNIKREMVQLEIDATEGRISEVERTAKEDELLERLAVARQRATEEKWYATGEEIDELTAEERSGDG